MSVLGAALLSGFGGWAIENIVAGPRYSTLLPGIPFLPVYAASGAAMAIVQPAVRDLHPIARMLSYGAVLSGVEVASNYVEPPSRKRPVNLSRALLWGGLALLSEPAID